MRTCVIDIGSTSVRAVVYENMSIVDFEAEPLKRYYPEPGFVELDPEEIFVKGKNLLDRMLERYKVDAISITNQRTTSVLWDSKKSKSIFPALTWQDIRAKPVAESLNKLWLIKFGKAIGKIATLLYLTIPSLRNRKRIKYLVTISKLSFKPNHASVHLMWMLQNLKNRNMDNLRFGTIDSWFIYRLCGEHLTDYTNASATGIYDIFFDKWSENILKIIGFPEENLPEVKESDSFFGEYRKIPIASVVADQQASLFSLCCFEKGMVKCTNGTGTFVDINVGEEPKASLSGLIPMVGIRLRNLRRYILEGYVSFSGSSIEWIKSLGLLETPEESYRLAEMSEDENLLLVPSFTGLGTPYYTESPGVLWGISNKTSKEDIVKALLESIAFRISEIVSLMDREVSLSIREIRMDGKMSSNDFLLQRVADTTGLKVVRSRYLEGSSFGAHLIAGLSTGEWKLNELKFLGENTFERKKDVTEKFNRWLRLLNETIKKGWI